MSNTDPLPTPGASDDTWGDELNTNLNDIEDGEGNLLPDAVQDAITEAGTLVTGSITLAATGNAEITLDTDAAGNPQIIEATVGPNPTSVILDNTGFYPAQGTSTPLGTPAEPWISASITGLTQMPTGTDGLPILTATQVEQLIASIGGGGLTVPGAATGLSATVSSGSVALSWTITTNTQGGLTSQQIWRSAVSGAELTSGSLVHTDSTGSATSYTDTTVVNAGGPYYYVVVEVNAQGSSVPSNEGGPYNPVASATIPNSPTGLHVASTSGSNALTWILPTNNGGAALDNNTEVWRGTTSGGETLLVGSLNASTVSYTDSTVSNGTTYYYYVKVHNSVGYSAASAEASGYYPSSGGPPVPSGFTSADLVFSDDFPGSSLNSSNWESYEGTTTTRWSAGGLLASPYSGVKIASNPFISLYNPSQLTVSGSVLSLNAVAYPSGTYASDGYTVLSGAITSLFTFPSGKTQYYAQASIKFPDCSAGAMPAFWLLPPSSAQELDIAEGGFTGSYTANTQMHSENITTNQSQVWSTGGVNITTGFNTYSCLFIPGTSWTVYFNGTQVFQSNDTSLTYQPYGLQFTFQWVKSSASGWHTTGSNYPQTMEVDWVQIYAK